MKKSISVFGYKNKKKYPIYVSTNTFKRHVNLLLTGDESKRHYIRIKDFNTCMYDHALYHGRIQAFSTQEILKPYIKDCFKINNKQDWDV